MTIIIANKQAIVADRRINAAQLKYDGGSKLFHFKKKQTETQTKFITATECVAGTTGSASNGLRFLDWFEDNWFLVPKERDYSSIPFEPEENGGGFSVLILYNDGTIGEFYNHFRELPIVSEVHAHGSGRDFALGYYNAIPNILDAARTASHFSTECGPGYDYFCLDANGCFFNEYYER